METDQNKIFASVVICTFNRSAYLGACIESILAQNYPRDRYEVIVVDDGSTDATPEVARTEGIRFIRHASNKGLPAARNTGIAAAKGAVVAFIDDDAVADPDWLEHLVAPFADPTVSASGGRTVAYKTNRLAERYLAAEGSGNPAPLEFGKSKNPLWRFWVYLKDMFAPLAAAAAPMDVQAVFGLNCAYRTAAVEKFGGFDEVLTTDEDSELSVRFRDHGARIMFVPAAIIHHRHRESIASLIRQKYYRAESTFRAYKKEGKVPPIFPIPLFYVALAGGFLFLQPEIGLLFAIIGPLLLYCWWPIRALRENKFEYCAYSYIQLVLESAVVLGLVRGKFRSIIKTH